MHNLENMKKFTDERIKEVAGRPDAIPDIYREWFLKGWRVHELLSIYDPINPPLILPEESRRIDSYGAGYNAALKHAKILSEGGEIPLACLDEEIFPK